MASCSKPRLAEPTAGTQSSITARNIRTIAASKSPARRTPERTDGRRRVGWLIAQPRVQGHCGLVEVALCMPIIRPQ